MSAQPPGLSQHSNKIHITEWPKFCAGLYISVALSSKSQQKIMNNYNFLMFITNRGANYMQQSPSEANSSSASQKIPYILWNPKFRSSARLIQSMLSRPTCSTSIKITRHNKILIMKDKHSTDLPKIYALSTSVH
jgi:hypothetical protein